MFDDMMKTIESRAKRFGPMRDANACGRIRKGSFMTDGCGWSKACCNMAAELAEGIMNP